MNCSHRYEGLVNYIGARYHSAAEIGIGHFPDVAFVLLQRGVRIFATDIKTFQYEGLKVMIDDIMKPDLSLYIGLDLVYSLRPPQELVSYMVQLAKKLSTDLIIKPLSSDYLGGQLVRHRDTAFFIWNYPMNHSVTIS